MNYRKVLSSIKKPVSIGIIATIALVLIFFLVLYERYLVYKGITTRELTNAANEAKERLEADLDEAEVAVATLSYIVEKYGIKNDFDEVAKKIKQTNPSVDELALVEGEIITYVYPLAGNEKALGHNIFKDSNQNRQVFETLRKNQLTFSGPNKLVQGGMGIIARQPIYIDGKYFGLATAVLNPARAFQKVILNSEYSYQVSKTNPHTGAEDFFLPQSKTFILSSAVSVTLNEGGWKIYVCYSKRQNFSQFNFILLGLFGVMLSFFGGFLVWHIMSQPERLKVLVDERTKQLAASEEKYHSLFDRASDAISIIDYKGNILDANTNMCQVLGYSKEELLQMTMEDLVEAEGLKTLPIQYDMLVKDISIIVHRKLKKKSGEVVAFEVNARNIGGGRIMGIGRNVTELRKAEQQIELSEKILRSAFDYSALGMAFISLDGKYLKVNKELCDIIGYSEEELLGMKLMDVTYPDDTPRDLEYLDKMKRDEVSTYRKEKRYYHKNGSIVWGNVNVSVVKDENDQPSFFVTQVENITEKKKMTGLLKEKEEQLRIFIEHSPAALAMFDKDMNYIMISNRYRTDYNLGGIDVIGKNHYEIFPTIPEHWKKIHKECLAGAIRKSDEDSFEREDGTVQWLKWEIRPWRKNSEEIGGIILFSEMITELKESQLNFKNLVERSLVGVYVFQNGKYPYVSPKFAEIFGYTQEEFIDNITSNDIIYEEDRPIIEQRIKDRIEKKIESVYYQARAKKKDGSIIWFEVYGSGTIYKGAPAIIGTLQDITERKNAETIIVNERNFLNTIIDGLPGIFYVFQADGRMIRWNKDLERITGYSRMEISKMKTGNFVNPSQLGSIAHHRKNIFETGKASAEVEILTKDKRLLVYYITIMPVVYNGENCILGIGIDFTEKKATELALIKKNWEIGERVKELRCLFKISELANRELSIEEVIKECVLLVPPAYQYPEITCAQIVFGEKTFGTEGFIETKWKQEAFIEAEGNQIGKVTVCYTQEKPPFQEGPFLEEERHLINSIAGILGNSTRRKLAGEEIVKLNRLYHFTSAINEMMLRVDDRDKIFSEACQIAIEYGKFRMAWIGVYNPELEKVVPLAWAGHIDGYLDQLKISIDKGNFSKGPTGNAIRNQRHYYCNDIANDPIMLPWKSEALQRGYRSSICLPIIINSKVVAVFNLYMDQPFFFNEQEIKLLKEVTDDIAYAVEKIELRALQKQSEERLKESEEKFRKLVEETMVGVFILQDGVFKYVNPQVEQISGYSKDELIDVPFDIILHKDDLEEMRQKYFARITGRSLENHYFMRGVRKDGAVRYIEIIASVINYQSREAIIGTAVDITEQIEEENRISKAVIDAQENERQQISMELHDNVKQIMAASLLNVEFIGMNMSHDETMVRIVGNVKNYIRDAIEELRKLSHKLAPSVDLNVPLEEKIKALVGVMNVSKQLKVSYKFKNLGQPICRDAQLAIYRILQEQLTNVLKYSKATTIKITLTKEDGNIIMIVADNGVGFDTTIRKKGIGLENIKRRMQTLQGKMEIISEPGKGCTLKVQIPVE
jgi:PAS domain S-box-containing protein